MIDELMPTIIAGTDAGVRVLGADERAELESRSIGALARDGDTILALADGHEVLRREGHAWTTVATLPGGNGRCILATPGGILVGTEEAHLDRVANGSSARVDSFEAIAGRERWFTPWGGPPATRSMSAAPDGALYVNVHVGGIAKSTDAGRSWEPTIEIEVDAHEVRAHAHRPGLVLAATAHGLATSRDSARSWELEAEGLRATYSRAVALAGDTVLLSASDGPRGGHAAVYRRPLDGAVAFERCSTGLPEWFDDNIDSGCLDAAGDTAAFGTAAGSIHASADAGETWERLADGLPPIRWLLIADPRDQR